MPNSIGTRGKGPETRDKESGTREHEPEARIWEVGTRDYGQGTRDHRAYSCVLFVGIEVCRWIRMSRRVGGGSEQRLRPWAAQEIQKGPRGTHWTEGLKGCAWAMG